MKVQTKFGKFLKDFRTKRNETIADMADKTGYKKSFICEIGLGRRAIPQDFDKRMAESYEMTDDELKELQTKMYQCMGNFKIEAETPFQRLLLGNLRQNLTSFDDSKCERIYQAVLQ